MFNMPEWIGTRYPYAFYMGNDGLFHIASVGEGSTPPCNEIIYHHNPVYRCEFDLLCKECLVSGYYVFDADAEVN